MLNFKHCKLSFKYCRSPVGEQAITSFPQSTGTSRPVFWGSPSLGGFSHACFPPFCIFIPGRDWNGAISIAPGFSFLAGGRAPWAHRRSIPSMYCLPGSLLGSRGLLPVFGSWPIFWPLSLPLPCLPSPSPSASTRKNPSQMVFRLTAHRIRAAH